MPGESRLAQCALHNVGSGCGFLLSQSQLRCLLKESVIPVIQLSQQDVSAAAWRSGGG